MSAPALSTQLQGHASVSADNLNTYVQWCQNISQLRSFIGLPGMTLYLQGISTPDDGGQGFFVWYATVTEDDDGRNYIKPVAASNGGWIRIGPNLVLPIPQITGALSSVTDPNALAVMASIIDALVSLGLVTNGTS